MCVAVDSSGNVYVGGQDDYIQKFDSNGKFITKWNSENPVGVAVDSSGNVYVAGGWNFSNSKVCFRKTRFNKTSCFFLCISNLRNHSIECSIY